MTEAVVESAATAEQQQEAETLGWIPPSRYKGDPETFVDADEYIKRGETVLPIVKAQNKKLHAELRAMNESAQKTSAELATIKKRLEEADERAAVDKQKALDKQRAELKGALAQASEEGDHAAVAEITEQMTQLAATPPEETKTAAAAEIKPMDLPPDLVAWHEDNPWYGTDRRKTSLALGIAQELRDAGEKAVGRAFWDKVTEELDATLGAGKPAGEVHDKVAGARGSGGGGGGSAKAKTYASLPAEAKKACEDDVRRFVGPDKRYKTAADWRARYTEIYYENEA